MDHFDKTFSEIVCLLKSWIPWRSEPPTVSRDFWMPDQSCRVCYDCDSQFTVFNRRHHCRLCGRVFCAKCTANSVPVPSTDPRTAREEWEKIRVCNYCFRQWQQGVATFDNGIQVPNLDLSSSPPSTTSFISTKSSGTVNSSSIAFGSMPYSVGSNQRALVGSVLSADQASEMETSSGKQREVALERSKTLVDDVEYQTPCQYAFSMNRSDTYLQLDTSHAVITLHMHQKYMKR